MASTSTKCKLLTRSIHNYIRKYSFVEGQSFMPINIMPDEHYLEFPFVLCIVRGIKNRVIPCLSGSLSNFL